jgi:hypothetical protein
MTGKPPWRYFELPIADCLGLANRGQFYKNFTLSKFKPSVMSRNLLVYKKETAISSMSHHTYDTLSFFPNMAEVCTNYP